MTRKQPEEDHPGPMTITPKRLADQLHRLGEELMRIQFRIRTLAPFLERDQLELLHDRVRNAAVQAVDLGSAIRVGQVAIIAHLDTEAGKGVRPLIDLAERRGEGFTDHHGADVDAVGIRALAQVIAKAELSKPEPEPEPVEPTAPEKPKRKSPQKSFDVFVGDGRQDLVFIGQMKAKNLTEAARLGPEAFEGQYFRDSNGAERPITADDLVIQSTPKTTKERDRTYNADDAKTWAAEHKAKLEAAHGPEELARRKAEFAALVAKRIAEREATEKSSLRTFNVYLLNPGDEERPRDYLGEVRCSSIESAREFAPEAFAAQFKERLGPEHFEVEPVNEPTPEEQERRRKLGETVRGGGKKRPAKPKFAATMDPKAWTAEHTEKLKAALAIEPAEDRRKAPLSALQLPDDVIEAFWYHLEVTTVEHVEDWLRDEPEDHWPGLLVSAVNLSLVEAEHVLGQLRRYQAGEDLSRMTEVA